MAEHRKKLEDTRPDIGDKDSADQFYFRDLKHFRNGSEVPLPEDLKGVRTEKCAPAEPELAASYASYSVRPCSRAAAHYAAALRKRSSI